MNKLLSSSIGWLALASAAAGCGSGTEPLSAISPPNAAPPQMSLPISSTVLNAVQPFNQSGNTNVTASDGFNLTVTPTGGQNVLAPAPGIVTAIDNTIGTGVVYIYHSSHLSSRLSQLQIVSVQPGQIVQAGSAIGLSPTLVTNAVHFSVFQDGNIACPLSYLTPTDQRTVSGHLQGQLAPCL